MGRLIDADLLREDILNDSTFDNNTINYYLNIIDRMGTVLDVDKVVGKIEEKQKQCNAGRYTTEYEAFEESIKILKGAIKDEN